MKKTKKAICALRRLLLLILILSLALTSCGQAIDNGFAEGFNPHGGCDDSLPHYLAILSERSIYPVDDVLVTYYYGLQMSPNIDTERKQGLYYSEGELYFTNDNSDVYFIRRTDEPLTSEEYRVNVYYESNKLVFNHSETLKIPRELFVGESGFIRLEIRAKEYNFNEHFHLVYPVMYRFSDNNTVELIPKSRWTSSDTLKYNSITWPWDDI